MLSSIESCPDYLALMFDEVSVNTFTAIDETFQQL
jgi:hypothetical protein